MGIVTIKILVQSVNVGQIAKKTIQFHIPKDLLKISQWYTYKYTTSHTQAITCAKHGKLGFEYRGNPCCKDTRVSSGDIKSFRPKIVKNGNKKN